MSDQKHKRPLISNFPYKIDKRDKELMNRFSKLWKKTINEQRLLDKKRKKHPRITYDIDMHYSSALILLRNLILGYDVYRGFEPNLNIQKLKNGYAWNDKWYYAYRDLYIILLVQKRKSTDIFHNLILSSTREDTIDFKAIKDSFPDYLLLCGSPYLPTYASKVNEKIASHLEFFPEDVSNFKTFESIMDLYDSSDQFNFISKKQYLEMDDKISENFEYTSWNLARQWLYATRRNNRHSLVGAELVRINSLYSYNMGDRKNKVSENDFIHIKLADKYKLYSINRYHFLIPVKCLWDLNWIHSDESQSI